MIAVTQEKKKGDHKKRVESWKGNSHRWRKFLGRASEGSRNNSLKARTRKGGEGSRCDSRRLEADERSERARLG